MQTQQRKTAVAALSVLSNTTLVVLKLVVGLLIGSVSVISEAIHSGMDLVASVIALVSVRTSGKPADPRHPYGHGKIENISGTVEALLIFVAAGGIIWEAIRKFLDPQPIGEPAWGVAVMAVSAVVNAFVSRTLYRVGRATDSMALQADGLHLRTDVFTSAGVMGGLGLIWLGERLLPGVNLHWLDPVAAIAVALLIIKAAWDLTLESSKDLLDHSLPDDEVKWIEHMTRHLDHPVEGMHDLRTRKAGPYRFIELHLVVDGNMTVHESHLIADEVERRISDRFPGARALVHIDPYDDRPAG